jgi:hypothetical protein
VESSIYVEKDQTGKFLVEFNSGCSGIDSPPIRKDLADKCQALEVIARSHDFFRIARGNVLLKSSTLSQQEQDFFYPLIEGYNSLAAELRAANYNYD